MLRSVGRLFRSDPRLDMAVRSIVSGGYRRALVIGADCVSKITTFQDRTTCVLFGDGAGACLVEAADKAGVLASY